MPPRDSTLDKIPALVKLHSGTMLGNCYISNEFVHLEGGRVLFPVQLEWVDSIEAGRTQLSRTTYSILSPSIMVPFTERHAQYRSLNASRSGSASSELKRNIARANGAKGGRPPKNTRN